MNALRTSALLLTVTCAAISATPASAVMPGAVDLEVRRAAPARELSGPARGALEPRLEIGNGVRVFAGTPARERLTGISRTLVDADPGFFGVRGRDLADRDVRTFSDAMTYVTFRQVHDGVEVFESGVTLVFKDGKLVLKEAATFPGISLSTVPVIDAGAADRVAAERLAAAGLRIDRLESPSVAVVFPSETASGVDYRLGFKSVVRTREPVGRWLTIVAADGSDEILYRRNLVAFEAAQVLVEVEPRFIGQTPVALPGRGHRISNGVETDADGIFESTAGDVTLRTAGPWFTVDNRESAELTATFSVAATGFEQITWSAADGRLEELDAFHHAHTVRDRQLSITPDLGWLGTNLPVNVNVSGTCNAYYDGASINFFPTGGGCNATSRIADVVYHEYGHGLHHRIAGNLDSQIQEGVADYFAHTITEDPNLGPYFFSGNQEGIRNAEQVRVYPSGVNDYPGEPHQQGRIWTNTWWLLRKRMIAKHGPALGVRTTDLLHSNTLRGNPGYTTVYMQVLAADDDDGDLSNGTPNSCEINAEFESHGLVGTAQPDRGFLTLAHDPPAPAGFFQDANAPLAVSVAVDSRSPDCGGLDASSVALQFRVDGGAAQSVSLSGNGPFSGEIPGQPEGAVVEYWFTAREDAQGAEFTAPLGAPANVYRYYVGPLTTVFVDDFEGADGWSHGGALASQDDWERGQPKGLGFDPSSAYSGVNAWGNDLGLRDGNGLYETQVSNWLESPAIDCSSCEGTRLQFQRWLSVEGSQYDNARVLVNGQVVWENEPSTRNDLQWSFVDVDIASVADGQSEIRIRFELETDGGYQLGGWAIDDVAVMAVAGGAPPGTNPGTPVAGEALNGGCTCTLAGTADSRPSGFLMGLLAILAGGSILRRRRNQDQLA